MSDSTPPGRRPVEARRRRTLALALVGALALGSAGYLHNSSRLVGPPGGEPWLLAHRGLAQTFPLDGITNDTCTAERIHPPEHPYLENTIDSIRAAFEAGAEVVEFDIQLTRDHRFVVFHDHELACRTEGSGRIRDHTVAELQALDIGYRYTADGGASFPFRGAGVGLMPTLEEVLGTFPDAEFLIDVKSADPVEGERLADHLETLPDDRLRLLTVYGGDAPIAALSDRLPQVRVLSRAMLERCLLRYAAVGWTGYVPVACRNRQLHIPERYARWLWGWPHRFIDRMAGHDTRVVLVAGDGGFSEGFDSAEDWQRVPDGYAGVVWTNRIDLVAPMRQPAERPPGPRAD